MKIINYLNKIKMPLLIIVILIITADDTFSRVIKINGSSGFAVGK
jgi:hypothetical protein